MNCGQFSDNWHACPDRLICRQRMRCSGWRRRLPSVIRAVFRWSGLRCGVAVWKRLTCARACVQRKASVRIPLPLTWRQRGEVSYRLRFAGVCGRRLIGISINTTGVEFAERAQVCMSMALSCLLAIVQENTGLVSVCWFSVSRWVHFGCAVLPDMRGVSLYQKLRVKPWKLAIFYAVSDVIFVVVYLYRS